METVIETAYPSTKKRRYDLDWLRVIAFGLLILYHTGLYFNYWGWYPVHNNVLSYQIDLPMVFLSQWRMPLLFMISGAGVYWSLGKRTSSDFIGDRAIRILLPLIFGILFIVPPQTYFARLVDGFSYSYAEFYTHLFDDPKNNLPWYHLWYLLYIFTYSLVGLPIWLFLKSPKGRQLTTQWVGVMANPAWLIGLPVAWLSLDEILHLPENLLGFVGDWKNHFRYFSLFFFGYVLATRQQFWAIIMNYRRLTLLISVVMTFLLLLFYWTNWHQPKGYEVVLFSLLKTTNYWCWLLTIFGYAHSHLTFTNSFLKYTNQAVYPFYILHQTILIVIGYYLAPLDWPWYIKFSFLSLAVFSSCLFLYHFFIRPFRVVRLFFGIR